MAVMWNIVELFSADMLSCYDSISTNSIFILKLLYSFRKCQHIYEYNP